MLIIGGGRRNGKTLELIKLSHKNNIPIACYNGMHKEEIVRLAKQMNITIPEPFTYVEYKNGYTKGRHPAQGILIDRAELYLEDKYSDDRIYGITMESRFRRPHFGFLKWWWKHGRRNG